MSIITGFKPSGADAHSHDGHTHSHGHQHKHTHAHGGTPGTGGGMECCSHHNIELERYMLLYLVGGVLVVATVIARWLFPQSIPEQIAQAPALLGAILLGSPLFYAAYGEIRRGHASTSSLTSLAILAAIATGQFVVAGALAFILLVADSFVRQRAWGAQRAIEELVGLTPDSARILQNGQEVEVPLGQVKVGDTVRVRPGENLPVDGVVVTGVSSINQASLTGEAAPHEVQPGEPVYAGTTNLSSMIDLRVTQVGADTTIGKVTQLIREAEQSKSPRQLIIEQVARFFVPAHMTISAPSPAVPASTPAQTKPICPMPRIATFSPRARPAAAALRPLLAIRRRVPAAAPTRPRNGPRGARTGPALAA